MHMIYKKSIHLLGKKKLKFPKQKRDVSVASQLLNECMNFCVFLMFNLLAMFLINV